MQAAARRRAKTLAMALFAFVYLYAFPYFGALRHANELPRVLTTQQLVHEGTFELGARAGELGSRADIATTPDGRMYQNKAPGLPLVGVVAYAPLAAAYRLAGAGRPPLWLTTWVLRVVVVTLPSLLFLLVFRRIAERFAGPDRVARDGALLAVALGSLLFPYALVFMSHAPAAAATGTAFAVAVVLTRGEARSPRRAALAIGALLGLAMLVEYQAIFAAAAILTFVGLRGPERGRGFVVSAAAALPSLLVLGAYHAACFGSPFRTGYAYSVDPANRVGVMGIVGPSASSFVQLLHYGSNGLFALAPWVLLSFFGAASIARDPELRRRVGAEALVALVVAASYVLFVGSLEPEFGRAGWSVGPRYLAVAIPFFGWLAGAGLAATASSTLLRLLSLATVLAGILVHVLAATTYPHWPTAFSNPFFEVSVRLLAEGHAPHSLGTLVGLRGFASLLPLYVAVAGLVAWLLLRAGLPRVNLLLVVLLGALAVVRFRDVERTPEPRRTEAFALLLSTYEP